MQWVVIVLVLFKFLTFEVSSLKITDFRVPSKATNDVLLDCRYDLEGELLYDVKWYKDNQQFFRCVPGEAVQFHVDGIKIYFEKFPSLGSCPFTLTNLDAKAEGEYKCEVSAEGPLFKTEVAYSRLRVVPPSQIPDSNKQPGNTDATRATSTFQQESNTTWNAYSSKGYATHTWKCVMSETIFILCLLYCIHAFIL